MKNLFVPYKLAKAAYEHGFDEPCLRFYVVDAAEDSRLIMAMSEDGDTNTKLKGFGSIYTAAPTYQQLADWFRTKHHLEITVHTDCNTNEILGYYAILYGIMSWPVFRIRIDGEEFGDYYTTWNEAFINAFATLKKP